MMNTENLFKFVAIRTPQAGEESSSSTVSFDHRQWVSRITGLVTEDVSLEDARKRVSNDFMDSSAYFLRSPRMKSFLDFQAEIQRLLKISENETQFKSSFNSLLKQINPNFSSLEDFVASKEFKQLKESLWHSYYSNIALVDRRPQDRPELEFWLRFWHFLERLAAGNDFRDLIKNFNNWSLVAPNQLIRTVKTREAVEPLDDNSEDETSLIISNKIAEARKTIAQLRTTRKHIIKVLHSKLAEAKENDAKEEIERAKTTPDSGGSKSDIRAPWMLTVKDIGSDAEKILERFGLSLDAHDATQLSAILERQEAELESVVFKLGHTKRVTLVRGVPVRTHSKDALNGEVKD